MLDPGKLVRLDFRDYLQVGDVLGVDIDLTGNRLVGMHVSTYIDTPEDPVDLDVRLATLVDGSSYPEVVVLDAKAEELKVTIQNSGYRKVVQ